MVKNVYHIVMWQGQVFIPHNGCIPCTIACDIERKPNDCVVYGVILHELGAQQCHRRLMVDCGTAGLSMSAMF